MTSIATICGILPAALAIGPGSESRAPMAIAVLGGVTVSTILTLIVVPALYYVVSGRKRRILKFVESHA
jgi:multidrug efflux pump subunit AcrB